MPQYSLVYMYGCLKEISAIGFDQIVNKVEAELIPCGVQSTTDASVPRQEP